MTSTYYSQRGFFVEHMDDTHEIHRTRLLPQYREMDNFESEEVWADIEGYEGRYQVSNIGRVKSLARVNKNGGRVKERIMIPTYRKAYKMLELSKDGVYKNFTIHRLVSTAFLIKLDGRNHVNHMDCDKENNHWWNLEWVTPEENTLHAIANNLHRASAKSPNTIGYREKALKVPKDTPPKVILPKPKTTRSGGRGQVLPPPPEDAVLTIQQSEEAEGVLYIVSRSLASQYGVRIGQMRGVLEGLARKEQAWQEVTKNE
jgi:hypothetical protein